MASRPRPVVTPFVNVPILVGPDKKRAPFRETYVFVWLVICQVERVVVEFVRPDTVWPHVTPDLMIPNWPNVFATETSRPPLFAPMIIWGAFVEFSLNTTKPVSVTGVAVYVLV